MEKYLKQHCFDLSKGSVYQIQLSVRIFQEFLGLQNYQKEDLTEAHICQFLEHLRLRKGIKDEAGRTHYSNASMRKILMNCRAVYGLAGVNRDIWSKAIKRTPLSINPEKRATRRLKKADIQAILSKLPNERIGYIIGAFIGLSFGGAVRRGSILEVRMQDIQIVDNRLVCYLHKTKNKKNQKVVIAREFIKYITKLVQFRSNEGVKASDYLFCSSLGKVYHPRTINSYLSKYSILALGYSIGTHTGRYSLATQMLENGASYGEVKAVTGHSTIRMVERYDKREFGVENSPINKFEYR